MAVVTIEQLFRDFVTDGVPGSGAHNPKKQDIRDTLKNVETLAAADAKIVQLAENSWGYEDPTNTSKWLVTPLRSLLQSNYGAENVVLRNDSAGGKSIGVPSDAERLTEILPILIAAGGVTVVIGRNPLNDISQGRNAAQILADIATCKAAADAAEAVYLQPNCPPFNNPTGTNFYTTSPSGGTRGVADAVNAGLAAVVGAGNIIHLWSTFNDPLNDGQMLAAYWLSSTDRFHLNQAGSGVYAGLIIGNTAFQNAMTAAAVTQTAKQQVSRLDRSETWYTRALVAGRYAGAVGFVNAIPWDTNLDNQIYYWAPVAGDLSAGWGHGTTTAGTYNFYWLASSTQNLRFSLGPTATSLTNLFTKFQVSADATTFLITSATYGGGNGVGVGFATNGSTGYTMTAFGTGGGSFAELDITATTLGLNKVSGNPTFVIKRNGVVNSQFVEDGTNLIVGNIGLTNGVFLPHNANAWSALSDESIKENVEPTDAEAAAARIAAIEIVDYDRKGDANAGRQRGVIAQQAQTVYPELVSEVPGLTPEAPKKGKSKKAPKPLLGFQYTSPTLMADLIATNQLLLREVADLKARLDAGK